MRIRPSGFWVLARSWSWTLQNQQGQQWAQESSEMQTYRCCSLGQQSIMVLCWTQFWGPGTGWGTWGITGSGASPSRAGVWGSQQQEPHRAGVEFQLGLAFRSPSAARDGGHGEVEAQSTQEAAAAPVPASQVSDPLCMLPRTHLRDQAETHKGHPSSDSVSPGVSLPPPGVPSVPWWVSTGSVFTAVGWDGPCSPVSPRAPRDRRWPALQPGHL